MLADILQTHMNLEMAATGEMLSIASEVKPADCCLVPEKREELTTEGGLDVLGQVDYLRDYCAQLAEAGVRVSLFIDADERQLEAAVEVGAPVVEIHTGHYAEATGRAAVDAEMARIADAVAYGNRLGLQVNAGHGLDYHNVKAIAAIDGIVEFNIGHAIVARALFSGLAQAVSDMKGLIQPL
jgi:pyridoxine 5-phosphate synthase